MSPPAIIEDETVEPSNGSCMMSPESGRMEDVRANNHHSMGESPRTEAQVTVHWLRAAVFVQREVRSIRSLVLEVCHHMGKSSDYADRIFRGIRCQNWAVMAGQSLDLRVSKHSKLGKKFPASWVSVSSNQCFDKKDLI